MSFKVNKTIVLINIANFAINTGMYLYDKQTANLVLAICTGILVILSVDLAKKDNQ